MQTEPQIGIVVPTIGGRPEYLPSSLRSIRAAGQAFIVLVGCRGFDATSFIEEGLVDLYLEEENPSLPDKINQGFNSLPSSVLYINWLGDDDLLVEGSLELALNRILEEDQPALVYGSCEYIDPNGKHIFTNSSGKWAIPLLHFGPQLIPQPGSLYRRDIFNEIGQLSSEFSWAFDFELFFSLSKAGKAVFIPHTLAKFRWHPGSISVSRRRESVRGASSVRKHHLPKFLQNISEIWEFPIRFSTLYAGSFINLKLSAKNCFQRSFSK